MVTFSKITTMKQKRRHVMDFAEQVAGARAEVDKLIAAGEKVGPSMKLAITHVKGDEQLIQEFFVECVQLFTAAFAPLFGRAQMDIIQQPVSREWMASITMGLTQQQQLDTLHDLMVKHGITRHVPKPQA